MPISVKPDKEALAATLRRLREIVVDDKTDDGLSDLPELSDDPDATVVIVLKKVAGGNKSGTPPANVT